MYQLLRNWCINIILLEVDKSVQNFTCTDMVNSPWLSFQDSWACSPLLWSDMMAICSGLGVSGVWRYRAQRELHIVMADSPRLCPLFCNHLEYLKLKGTPPILWRPEVHYLTFDLTVHHVWVLSYFRGWSPVPVASIQLNGTGPCPHLAVSLPWW